MKQYINILLTTLLFVVLLTSCESLLEVTPEEVLLTEDYLGDDKLDARSALFGVLGQMQDITGQYAVLGEMRADLVDVSPDATDELRQINNHKISSSNSYADLTNVFSIINNCNFALEGIDTLAYDNLLLDDYASILRIRTWAQMQILINYGKLPYITKPIKSNEDLEEKYPLLSFHQALDVLIQNLEPISDVENVTKYENSLGYDIFKMIPDNNILLGDLNLWKGNFVTAAIHYKQFLDDNVSDNVYNLSSYGVTTTQNGSSYDVSTNWIDIFQSNLPSNEILNYIPFDDQFRQPNNGFKTLTEQMVPSALSILNWNEQLRSFEGEPYNNREGDIRIIGSLNVGDFSKIGKYQYEYFMWNRAAKIYLRYAEAINYAGYPEQALAIVNGIFNNPNVEPVDAPIFNNDEDFLNFDLDQYYTTNSSDEPTSGNRGIRGRVNMAPVSVDANLSEFETIQAVGSLILEEAALELAFEGNRWEDLIRFALRTDNPAMLADAVAIKFEVSGDISNAAIIRQKLMNPDSWYLPLIIPDNFIED